MSIADDPSQWLSKPRDNIMDKSMRPHTLADYHMLRDGLIFIHNCSPSSGVRKECKRLLDKTPRDRDEEETLV